ncbi:MAG: hypothetical protein NVS9B5_36320 [Terriglobales bacterium]
MEKPTMHKSPRPKGIKFEGSGTVVPALIRLELQGLTAIRLPLESSRNAIKMVPVGLFGRVIDCPSVFVPVQLPMKRSDAAKLAATIPVAPCSWLAALEKVGKV